MSDKQKQKTSTDKRPQPCRPYISTEGALALFPVGSGFLSLFLSSFLVYADVSIVVKWIPRYPDRCPFFRVVSLLSNRQRRIATRTSPSIALSVSPSRFLFREHVCTPVYFRSIFCSLSSFSYLSFFHSLPLSIVSEAFLPTFAGVSASLFVLTSANFILPFC